MKPSKLKKGDKFGDKYGEWQVIQVHPPQGKRRHWIYTLLNNETSKAVMVDESQLLDKENELVIHEK